MKLKQISKWDELEGKTIKKVIRNSVDALIFTDDTFCVFTTEYESSSIDLSNEMSITDLRNVGAISAEEAEALRADENAAEQKKQRDYRLKQYLQLKKGFGNDQTS